jgi:tetratricopeptide (TPR) repeat protein
MTKPELTLSQELSRAISACDEGKLIEAEQICQQVIDSKCDLFDAFHLLAVIQSGLGKKDIALASSDRALKLRPDSAEVLYTRGVTLHELMRFEDALASYDHALKVQPDFVEVLSNRGLSLHELKRFEEALASYNRALTAQPDFVEALSNRGNTLKELKRFEEALASYDRALKVQPDLVEVLFNRGLTLHELKRLEDALASYDQALKVRPDFAEALFSRGLILHRLKRFEEALGSFDCALTARSDYAEALFHRGKTLYELKRFEDALASYDRALVVRPDYAEVLSNRGNTLKDLERFEEALASYDRALKVRPDFAQAHNNRGVALKELMRFEEALASYDRALTVRPELAEAHNNRGIALMQLGRLSQARGAFERAVELAPDKTKYRRDLGNIVVGDAHLAALEKLAEDGAALSVGDRIELHFALGKAYDDQGRHAEAFSQWLDGNALQRQQITYSEATTLGMLDRVRAAFTSELIRTRQNAGNASPVPVFVIGMARSGSTLVEQILASHPKVFGGGELQHFEAAMKGIRKTPDGLTTFPEVVSGMTGEDYRNLGTRYLAGTAHLSPGAAHVTDKMLGNFMFAGLIHLALPNAPVIHTVRDPVDTCLSCFSKLFTTAQNHTYDLAELGRYYRHYQALMAHWHRILPPGRILDVRYEDVVTDLEGQARRIITHCGLNWDPRCLAFHQTQRPVLTASAVQVRQPIYDNAVGRWRAYEEFLGPLLAELNIAGNSN